MSVENPCRIPEKPQLAGKNIAYRREMKLSHLSPPYCFGFFRDQSPRNLLKEPLWLLVALESTFLSSAIAMKSRRVLLGKPDRQYALAILQLLSFIVSRTFSYRECMLLRLWLLTRVDCCCGGYGCCGSVTEELFLAD